MTSTVPQWLQLVQQSGSDFTVTRDTGSVECPCRTQQGFRDDIWHKTDKPSAFLIPANGGLLTGTFQYRVHFIYDQGEKVDDLYTTVPLVLKKVDISWARASERPPAGKGSSIGTRIYRKRIDVAGQPWLLVTEITDPMVIAYEDMLPDGSLSPGSPIENVCNDAGFLPVVSSVSAKGFIQPVQSGAVRRLVAEIAVEMFGEFEEDDHIGLVPCTWRGNTLDFKNWSETGTDRLTYNGRNYTVVAYNLIPDPADGNPFHHWEIGLRLVKDDG